MGCSILALSPWTHDTAPELGALLLVMQGESFSGLKMRSTVLMSSAYDSSNIIRFSSRSCAMISRSKRPSKESKSLKVMLIVVQSSKLWEMTLPSLLSSSLMLHLNS